MRSPTFDSGMFSLCSFTRFPWHLGYLFEQEIPETARKLVSAEPSRQPAREFWTVLACTVANAPSYLYAGHPGDSGAIIARGLGLL
jgi:hypothetical protein